MATLYKADDRNLLTSVLVGESVHLEPGAILDGLTNEQAQAKPHDLPYSIAELVAHMCYWQEWFNACLVSGFAGHCETLGGRMASGPCRRLGHPARPLSLLD